MGHRTFATFLLPLADRLTVGVGWGVVVGSMEALRKFNVVARYGCKYEASPKPVMFAAFVGAFF